MSSSLQLRLTVQVTIKLSDNPGKGNNIADTLSSHATACTNLGFERDFPTKVHSRISLGFWKKQTTQVTIKLSRIPGKGNNFADTLSRRAQPAQT